MSFDVWKNCLYNLFVESIKAFFLQYNLSREKKNYRSFWIPVVFIQVSWVHPFLHLLLLSHFSHVRKVTSVVSDTVRPHRWQPTRLPCPWDSPGKNTGVGCHFLLQCMKVKSESEVAQLCRTLSEPMDCSPLGSSTHGIFQARILEWGAIAFSDSSTYSPPINPIYLPSKLSSHYTGSWKHNVKWDTE